MSVPAEIQVLIQYRMKQAGDSLAAARITHERGLFRDSVNRSYYAMFYAVLALLCPRGEKPGKHTHAIAFFDRRFVKEGLIGKEYSIWLHEAFDLRQRADYREMIEISGERANEVLRMAERFVAEAQAFMDRQREAGKDLEENRKGEEP